MACCMSTPSIEGVQEDVVDILLNLEARRHPPERAATMPELRAAQEGPGPVTAGDIQLDHDVEVIIPSW